MYGRTRIARKADLTSTQLKVAQRDWEVLIRDAHAGYIDWDEFERNQVTLKQSSSSFSDGSRGAMPREGVGLLQGRVMCGVCGQRMRVRYQRVTSTLEPYYVCHAAVAHRAGKPCQSIRGCDVDLAISSLLLQTVAPAAIEVALAVEDEIAGRIEQANAMRNRQLERARYDAELARRRYMNVDPANRMVADALEADWNARLRQLDDLQQEHDRQRMADERLLADEARARIRALAADFAVVWNDTRVEPVERKRMLGLLIEDVTLLKNEQIAIHVRFRGGQTTSLMVDKRKPIALIRKTLPEVVGRSTSCSKPVRTGKSPSSATRTGRVRPSPTRRSSSSATPINLRAALRAYERAACSPPTSSPPNSACARPPSTSGGKADSCASIVTATCIAVYSSPWATSSSSKGKVGATVRLLRRLTLFNQPHKVQYEAYALLCGLHTGVVSGVSPIPLANARVSCAIHPEPLSLNHSIEDGTVSTLPNLCSTAASITSRTSLPV